MGGAQLAQKSPRDLSTESKGGAQLAFNFSLKQSELGTPASIWRAEYLAKVAIWATCISSGLLCEVFLLKNESEIKCVSTQLAEVGSKLSSKLLSAKQSAFGIPTTQEWLEWLFKFAAVCKADVFCKALG